MPFPTALNIRELIGKPLDMQGKCRTYQQVFPSLGKALATKAVCRGTLSEAPAQLPLCNRSLAIDSITVKQQFQALAGELPPKANKQGKALVCFKIVVF